MASLDLVGYDSIWILLEGTLYIFVVADRRFLVRHGHLQLDSIGRFLVTLLDYTKGMLDVRVE